jgi:hypothetical protein
MRPEEKVITTRQIKASNKSTPRFYEQDFRDAIAKHGYDVYLEKSLKCPCKSRNSEFLSDCRNCGGSGWLYINRINTRMVVQSMSLNPKYENWGVYGAEISSVTALPEERLSYMDKITVLNAVSEHSEVLHPLKYDEEDDFLYAYSVYPIIDVYFLGIFEDSNSKLIKLDAVEFSISDGNKIKIDSSLFPEGVEPRFTIRYSHNPAYYVMEMVRETMLATLNLGRGFQSQVEMPVHARAKRIDLFKDIENYQGDRLVDNSFKICQ